MNPGDFPLIDKQLGRCNALLAKIEAHVATRGDHRPRFRNTPVFFAQQFIVPTTSFLQVQDKSIVNNAEDCYLTSISYALYRADNATTPTFLTPLFDNSVGFFEPNAQFAFAWNFKLASLASWYRTNTMLGNTLSDLGGCPHRSAGFPEQNKPMTFSSRLKFVSGDSLLVRMIPMMFQVETTAAKLLHLAISFTGYRTEHLYEGAV